MACMHYVQLNPRNILVLIGLLGFATLSAGEDEQEQLPTLVFERGEIQLPGPILQRFYRCLCKQQTRICRQRYEILAGGQVFSNRLRVYRASNFLDEKECLESEGASGNFLCHPGDFHQLDYINCTRVEQSPDGYDRCKGSEHCQSFRINLNIDDCDYNCINTHWAVTSVGRRTFGSNPQLEETGSCDAPADSSVYSESDNESLMAAVAIGWVLFAILLGLNVAYIVYRFMKSRLKSNPSNPTRPVSMNNTYIGSPTAIPKGERQRKPETKRPVPDAPMDKNGYEYYTAYGQEPNDYNLIDEENVKPTLPKKTSKLEDSKTKLKQRPLPGYGQPKPSSNLGDGGANFGTGGYLLASQHGNTTQQSEAAALANGYAILEGGELSRKLQEMEACSGYVGVAGRGNSANSPDADTPNGYTILKSGTDSQNLQMNGDEMDTYNKASKSMPSERRPGVNTKPANMTDYDKLSSGKPGVAAEFSNPTSYNKASTQFEDRDIIDVEDTVRPIDAPYDVPRG